MYPVWTDDCDDWRHHIQANPGRLVMGRKFGALGNALAESEEKTEGWNWIITFLICSIFVCRQNTSWKADTEVKPVFAVEIKPCRCNCELWWLNCMMKVTKGVFFTHHHPGQDCHQYHAVWPSIGYCEVDIIWWHRQSPGAETKATGGGGGQRDWAGSLRPTLYIVKDTLLAHWDQTIVYNKNMLF